MSRIYAVTPNGEYIAFPDEAPVVEVDVRADLRAGRNPLAAILAAADALARTDVLHLRATLAPVPLIGMLSERGFVYHMESHDDEDWSVWFWRPG